LSSPLRAAQQKARTRRIVAGPASDKPSHLTLPAQTRAAIHAEKGTVKPSHVAELGRDDDAVANAAQRKA